MGEVTPIKSEQTVGELTLTKKQIIFIDNCMSTIGAKREMAWEYADLCAQIDKLKPKAE